MTCKYIGASFATSHHLCIICQKTTKSLLCNKRRFVSQKQVAAKILKAQVADRINKPDVTG